MNDWSKELMHMTKAEKKEYNKNYYQQHKNYWSDYYSNGKTVGRPMARPKNVTSGGSGVSTRPMSVRPANAPMSRPKNVTSGGSGITTRPTSVRPANAPMARPKNVTSGNGTGVTTRPASGKKRAKEQDPYQSTMQSWTHMTDMLSTQSQSNNYHEALGVPKPQQSTSNGKKKAKKLLEQFGKDWKSGSKSVKKAGKAFVDNWKSGAQSIKNLKLKKPWKTETTITTVPQEYGAPVYTTTVTRNKKRR